MIQAFALPLLCHLKQDEEVRKRYLNFGRLPLLVAVSSSTWKALPELLVPETCLVYTTRLVL
jgi:hypothetical protein